MALNKTQSEKIDEMIAAGESKPDISDELVGNHKAKSRDVDEYLAHNRTVQGALNIITRIAKKLINEGEQAKRKVLVHEIEKEAKRAIKMLQA